MYGTIEWDPGDAWIFTRVVDEGSFTAAAGALELPKSTVSRRVSRLEEQLGLQLLRRTTRSLSLTDAGRAFHAEASSAVEAFEAAGKAACSVLSEPHGRLRVTAPAELGTRAFGVLLDFNQAFPEVHLDLDLTNSYVDIIEQGYDVALRGGDPPLGTLTGQSLVSTDAFLVASPDYLRQKAAPKRARDLFRHESILFPRWLENSCWELTGKQASSMVPVKGMLTVNNLEAVRLAALRGCGIGLLPEGHIANDLADGTLVRVLPGLRKKLAGVWIVYPRTRYLSAKVRAFVEYVVEAYKP